MNKLLIGLLTLFSMSSFASKGIFGISLDKYTEAVNKMSCEDVKMALEKISTEVELDDFDQELNDARLSLHSIKEIARRGADCINLKITESPALINAGNK